MISLVAQKNFKMKLTSLLLIVRADYRAADARAEVKLSGSNPNARAMFKLNLQHSVDLEKVLFKLDDIEKKLDTILGSSP